MYPIFLLVMVSFDPTSYTVTEGIDGIAELMLVRSGNLNREVVVSVTTTSGSAIGMTEWVLCILTLTFPYTGVSDYTSVSRMVTFSAGQSNASVSVPITNDNVIEDSEMFSGSLSAVTENVDIVADSANVTIMDDDGELMSILCYNTTLWLYVSHLPFSNCFI